MKKIDVFLKYAWAFPDSPYYKYLLSFPPKNVNFTNFNSQKYDVIKKKNYFKKLVGLKSMVRKGLLYSPVFPFPKVKKGDFDLVHGAHCLISNRDIPYVSDMEILVNYSATSSKIFSKPRVKTKIRKLLARPNLKFILPWTETGKNELLQNFGKSFYQSIEEKIKVVYPAVPVLERKKIKSKSFNLIFISRYFFQKGGLYVCEAFEILKKKYDINLSIIGDYPEGFEEKYPDIDFVGLIPREDLMSKYFSKADLFLCPGFSDSFGFLFLEAMSLGIPIICVDGHSRKEVVRDGEVGFVLDRPKSFSFYKIDSPSLLQSMVEKTSELIENPSLLNKMGKEAKKEVVSGRFSLPKMQKDLYSVYSGGIR